MIGYWHGNVVYFSIILTFVRLSVTLCLVAKRLVYPTVKVTELINRKSLQLGLFNFLNDIANGIIIERVSDFIVYLFICLYNPLLLLKWRISFIIFTTSMHSKARRLVSILRDRLTRTRSLGGDGPTFPRTLRVSCTCKASPTLATIVAVFDDSSRQCGRAIMVRLHGVIVAATVVAIVAPTGCGDDHPV